MRIPAPLNFLLSALCCAIYVRDVWQMEKELPEIIKSESKDNVGSTFTIQLPAKDL